MSIGRVITRRRMERGWTQRQLAEKLGMHPNHVSRLEAGQMQPRPSTLEKLSRVFEVPTEELVAAGHDEPPPRLGQEDPELAQLLTQVGMLNEEQRLALRQVLRSMLTCQKLQHLASGQALSPL